MCLFPDSFEVVFVLLLSLPLGLLSGYNCLSQHMCFLGCWSEIDGTIKKNGLSVILISFYFRPYDRSCLLFAVILSFILCLKLLYAVCRLRFCNLSCILTKFQTKVGLLCCIELYMQSSWYVNEHFSPHVFWRMAKSLGWTGHIWPLSLFLLTKPFALKVKVSAFYWLDCSLFVAESSSILKLLGPDLIN